MIRPRRGQLQGQLPETLNRMAMRRTLPIRSKYLFSLILSQLNEGLYTFLAPIYEDYQNNANGLRDTMAGSDFRQSGNR